MKKSVLVLLAALALASCGHPYPTPVPISGVDASGPLADGALPSCGTVCAHGADLQCDWARPTVNGASCETVCENANRIEGPLRWDLGCRTRAASCRSSDLCP